MRETCHIPVLLDEVLAWLDLAPGMLVVDGTFGGGGHTQRIAQAVGPRGRVLALDRDPAAIERGRALGLAQVEFEQANFAMLPEVLEELRISHVDRVLLDLGLSSDQLADPERGFSFDSGGEFDLRFDTERGEPAWRLLQRLPERELADLIYEFGEERFSRRIARRIVEVRRQSPPRGAREVADLITRCLPRPKPGAIHPATRTFQAFRIAVNRELESLDRALAQIPSILPAGGRLAIISFHSLEDRRVKEAFRDDERYQALTRKPVRPNEGELAANPRSRSARLRVAERI